MIGCLNARATLVWKTTQKRRKEEKSFENEGGNLRERERERREKEKRRRSKKKKCSTSK